MKKQFKVPFDENGNQLKETIHYSWKKVTEVDNYEFDDTLFYDRYEGAKSTSVIVWKTGKGKEYRSSMEMLHEILSGESRIDRKDFAGQLRITSKFTFVKRGTSIFLTLAK